LTWRRRDFSDRYDLPIVHRLVVVDDFLLLEDRFVADIGLLRRAAKIKDQLQLIGITSAHEKHAARKHLAEDAPTGSKH
jgi:hypothetical protein